MLHIHGAPVIGRCSADSSAGADLSDIDLTVERKDKRVIYECASPHAFIAKDGTIKFAAPDEWPLEYRDGVAIGRHEPELQSTNYFNSAHPELLTVLTAGGGTLTREVADSINGLPTISAHFTTPDAAMSIYSLIGSANGQPAPKASGVASVYISVDAAQKFSCYSNNTTDFTPYDLKPGLQRFIFRDSKAMTYVVMGLRNVKADYVAQMSGFQFEAGEISTSPVLADGTPTIRAQSFARVLNPNNAASGVQIWYTDGSVIKLDFNSADSVEIPISQHDWCTRYIERISYIKAETDPLRDIDLTTAELDSRVTYIRPGNLHYYAADGSIQQIGDDTWPLEYRDGVAAGRHEPEPQATNLKIGSRAPDAALYLLAKTGSTALSPAGIDELIEYKTTSTTATPALVTDITLAESGQLTISVFGRNGTAEMTVRKEGASSFASFTNEFTRSVLSTDYDATATRNRYSVFFPRTLGAIGYIWHMQFETGGIATSPIITGISAATRAAAFASVRIFNGATGLKITYNDGTDTTITFTGDEDGYCQLPQSSRDWGTRYITRISYIRSE